MLELIKMSQKMDLQKIENKAWRTYMTEDGLYDIFMGIMLLTLAVQAYFYNIWFTSFIFADIFIVTLGKRYITMPRIGLVNFGTQRIKRQLMMMIGLLMVFLAMLLLYYISASHKTAGDIAQRMVFPAFIAIIFIIVALFLNYTRLGIYGLLFASTEVLRGVYGEAVRDITVTALGIFTLIVGFYVLMRFLKKYPLPEREGISL